MAAVLRQPHQFGASFGTTTLRPVPIQERPQPSTKKLPGSRYRTTSLHPLARTGSIFISLFSYIGQMKNRPRLSVCSTRHKTTPIKDEYYAIALCLSFIYHRDSYGHYRTKNLDVWQSFWSELYRIHNHVLPSLLDARLCFPTVFGCDQHHGALRCITFCYTCDSFLLASRTIVEHVKLCNS